MPLKTGTSRETFSHNVAAEMDAGRPQAQSLAIAYAKKREAMKRKKLWRGGYADGGEVPVDPKKASDAAESMRRAFHYEDGGIVGPDRQDDDLGVTGHYNTSGEPHTEDLDEITHPMEFMADGGEIEDEDEYMPGATTSDVMAEPMPSAFSFHRALKRRPRFRR